MESAVSLACAQFHLLPDFCREEHSAGNSHGGPSESLFYPRVAVDVPDNRRRNHGITRFCRQNSCELHRTLDTREPGALRDSAWIHRRVLFQAVSWILCQVRPRASPSPGARYFPLYESNKGKYALTIKIPRPSPVEDFLKLQGRFRHLFKSQYSNELYNIQESVEANYERISKLCNNQ